MSQFLRLLFFSFLLTCVSCTHEKPCSGLNPETGKFNTKQKIHKGKRKAHSQPEKKAIKNRQKQVKSRKKGFSSKGRYGSGGGIFHFHFGGSVSGGGSVNVQQRN